MICVYSVNTTIFLSTLSLRRATSIIQIVLFVKLDFYPRSPCGERLKALNDIDRRLAFLSTLSLRRATGGPGL